MPIFIKKLVVLSVSEAYGPYTCVDCSNKDAYSIVISRKQYKIYNLAQIIDKGCGDAVCDRCLKSYIERVSEVEHENNKNR